MTVPPTSGRRRPLHRDWRAWVVAVFLAGVAADIIVLIVTAAMGRADAAANAGVALFFLITGGATIAAPYTIGALHGRKHAVAEISEGLSDMAGLMREASAALSAIGPEMQRNFETLHEAMVTEIRGSAERNERAVIAAIQAYADQVDDMRETLTRIEQNLPGSPVRRLPANRENVRENEDR